MDESWKTVTMPEAVYIRLKECEREVADLRARLAEAERKHHELANRIDALCHEHGAAMMGSAMNSLNCLVGVLVGRAIQPGAVPLNPCGYETKTEKE